MDKLCLIGKQQPKPITQVSPLKRVSTINHLLQLHLLKVTEQQLSDRIIVLWIPSRQQGWFTTDLKQIDFDGSYSYSNVVEVDNALPSVFALEQNYPNPFNPSTTIQFGLPVEAKVTIYLFNTLGEKVAQLANTDFAAGNQRVDFNASNLSSGVYFYTIEAIGVDGTNFVTSKKMMLMK